MNDLPPGVENRGGGWYKLPGGEKVRGVDAVLSASNGASAKNSSEMVNRIQFAQRTGLQYSDKRDVAKVAGYTKNPTYADYYSYWDRHPVAGRIVDMPVETTWKDPPEIIEPEKEDGTEFTKAFEALADRLKLWSRLERVDRLSRIGQYAVLLIGERSPSVDLASPLRGVSGPDGIAFLAHYSQRDTRIDSYVKDTGDERFGLPEFYSIDFSRRNSNFTPGRQSVHWTRIVHVAEDALEDDLHGRPILRRVLNTIFNDEKVDAASAEAFWQLADKILMLKIDPEARVDAAEMKKIGEAMEEIMHDLRRQMALQGGELGWIGGDTPDPTGLADVLATKMAVGGDIPKRILFGSERGELASSQDERNYAGKISSRQEKHAEPNMLRALIDRFTDLKALPRPETGGYEVQWQNLFEPTDEEIAERNKSNSETARNLTPVGGDPYELVEIDDAGVVVLRASEEVWKDRGRQPGEPLDIGPPEAIEGDEEPEIEEAA